ncbi:SNF7 family protein [Tieghemostelium lacteum]|uniref:SNF7 family protein n=1 Tax=Tieghemostelium lacteum TaxID=361077 RepID=A0A151ZHJ2_TIELA|nr:SNF7 family protein [Tieghemostelium lacteum]|eukprot:KYQ93350.1 SNF7 family protein [Tieghemostelium lacteum]
MEKKQSVKSQKNEKTQKDKLKKAIEQGNMDGARIYAQNAIREKNQSLNYLRLASRVDAVASRVETAIRMKSVTGSMASIVKSMEKSMRDMDLEKITHVMDQFERQFEDLDVQSVYVENAMNQTTTLSTPAEQVDLLISQVADEHGLALGMQMGSVPSEKVQHAETDELTERLNRLKQKN